MNLFVYLLLAQFAIVLGQRATKFDCSARGMVKLDEKLARSLTIGNSGRRYPENADEWRTYCSESNDLLSQIEAYRKVCLKDLAKQVTGVMMFAGKKNTANICREGAISKKFLGGSDCPNQGAKEMRKCYNNLIDGIVGATNEKDDKKKIPFICCEYVKFLPCLQTKLSKMSKCSEDKVNWYVDFIRGMIGNSVDMLCGDYSEDSDKCDQLGPPPKRKKSQKRPRSFAFPMIEILSSFPEV